MATLPFGFYGEKTLKYFSPAWYGLDEISTGDPTALRCLLTSGETAPTSVTWHDAKGAEILSSERYTVSQTAYTTGRLTATLLSLAPAEDCSYTCTASFASGDLVGFVNLDLVGRLYLYLPVHFCDWLPLSS